jgi:hypothetical protein
VTTAATTHRRVFWDLRRLLLGAVVCAGQRGHITRSCDDAIVISADHSAGEQVLNEAADLACAVLGDQLDAVFALGSLAHGGFAPLVSDVDIALILRELAPDTVARMTEINTLTRQQAPSPLADRLSIFYADWDGVRHGAGQDARLPAVDRLDLIESGRLLYGTDRRASAVRPDGQTLVREGADFACAKFDQNYLARLHDPWQLVSDGARAVTKAVLFPVRFLYTLRTHRAGHNADAATWYIHHGAHPALSQAAMIWREHGIGDPERATAVLEQGLTGLYIEFFNAYDQALTRTGNDCLAEALRRRHGTLRQLEQHP